MTVVIFDAETRSALAALRVLQEKCVPTIAVSHKKHALSFYSRATGDRACCPNPGAGRNAFVAWVDAYLSMHPDAVPMSFTDITTDALRHCAYMRDVSRTRIVPEDADFARATDKRALAACARALGIPTPTEIDGARCTNESMLEGVTFPVIVKPARSVSWHGACAYKDTARVVHSGNELVRYYQELSAKTSDPPLVQEMLYGDEYGVSLIAREGTVLALFAHRRLRSITPYGGVSTLRESVTITPEMRSIATRLTEVLRWNGVMMIELKRNNVTGKLTLIEVNARFWGSLFLAIASGVNFPYHLYQLAIGAGDTIREVNYPPGVRARHLITDLSHFYALRWKAFTPKHLREFCTFTGKNLYFDVWSFRDPLPGFVELFQFIRKKL